jgi:prolipoprotein diacylglyceryltransferase
MSVVMRRIPLLLAAFMIAGTAGVRAQVPDEYMSRLEERINAGNHMLLGAGVGFVVGAGVTYLLLHSGGSTSLCDRNANQDAIRPAECLGLTIAGGVVGAGIGALIGRRIRRGGAVSRQRVGVTSVSGDGQVWGTAANGTGAYGEGQAGAGRVVPELRAE